MLIWLTMKNKTKLFWGIVQGSLAVFALLTAVYALNSLSVFNSLIDHYNLLPNTREALNEFLKQLGIMGAIGSLLDIVVLTARWVRYVFQRPFFS
jgi:hypothetical protein